jgi:hypothetical protein
MEDGGEGDNMNETPDEKNKDDGREQDLTEYARAVKSVEDERPRGSGGSFLRGCGIALAIAFLLFAFVVGACFMSM